MLPGESDAAVDLDAVLCALHRGVGNDDGGDVRGEVGGVVTVVEGRGGIPQHRARLLQRDAHVGALVLDALELADRTPELHPRLRVLGCGGHAPGHHADRLRTENDGGDGPDAPRAQPVEDPVGAHPNGVGGDPCGAADHVDAVLHCDGDVRGIDDGPADVVAAGDREKHGVGVFAAEDGVRDPGDAVSTLAGRGIEWTAQRDRGGV